VIELFNKFHGAPRILGAAGGVLHRFKQMGVRPSATTPVWIAGLLERHQISLAHCRARLGDLGRAGGGFLELDFLKELDRPFS
jgi:hypothetical protein